MSDNKPIRAKTPYNFFYQEMFQEIRQQDDRNDDRNDDDAPPPVGSYTPIFLLIADKWKQLDEQDKLVYEQLAAQDKRRYMSEMAAWHETNDESLLWENGHTKRFR